MHIYPNKVKKKSKKSNENFIYFTNNNFKKGEQVGTILLYIR